MRFLKSKFSLKKEADTLNKISMYLQAHMALSDALGILTDQAENRKQKKTLVVWRAAIENGKTLAEAFVCDGAIAVSNLSLHAARLGDRSASLAASLKQASEQMKKTLTLKKKIIGALAYPLAIFVGTTALVLGLIIFIFPKIVPLFETLKVKLPFSTRLLIFLSKTISGNWLSIIAGIAIAAFGIILLFKLSGRVRRLSQDLLIKSPIIGRIVRTRILCSTFDSVYLLLGGGEQLDAALLEASKTVGFYNYRKIVEKAGEEVRLGRSLGEFFRSKKKLFPTYISGLIYVGERTGNIENSFRDIAEITREELEDQLKILTATLEPVLMVSMSLLIGFVALSIILPIYGITSHFQHV